jgi:hypothetical protein
MRGCGLHGINIHAKFGENQSKKIKMRQTDTHKDDLVNLQLFPDRRKADQNIPPANLLLYIHIHMRLLSCICIHHVLCPHGYTNYKEIVLY